MADIARCLADGFSTTGSPGAGLGAVVRVSDRNAIYSRGVGTAVMARFLTSGTMAPGADEMGIVIDAYPGGASARRLGHRTRPEGHYLPCGCRRLRSRAPCGSYRWHHDPNLRREHQLRLPCLIPFSH